MQGRGENEVDGGCQMEAACKTVCKVNWAWSAYLW